MKITKSPLNKKFEPYSVTFSLENQYDEIWLYILLGKFSPQEIAERNEKRELNNDVFRGYINQNNLKLLKQFEQE